MIQKINMTSFLQYLKKYNPDFLGLFKNKHTFTKASYIIYLQEHMKKNIQQHNNQNNNQNNSSEDGLFIPINIDTI
mgnify:FL=1